VTQNKCELRAAIQIPAIMCPLGERMLQYILASAVCPLAAVRRTHMNMSWTRL